MSAVDSQTKEPDERTKKKIKTINKEFQVFAMELEAMNPFDTIKMSSWRMPQLQKASEQDPVMQTLKTTIMTCWPEGREKVPVQIREY